MRFEIDRQLFLDAIENTDGALYDEYSGRHMYGATCPGIVGKISDLAILFIELATRTEWSDDMDIAYAMAQRTRSDDMGNSYIYYWPDLVLI